MQQANTILEDIGAEIGYNATANLCGWFGGKWIWVPAEASPGHQIAKVIGNLAFERLVRGFGNQRVFIPKDTHQSVVRLRRRIYDMVRLGNPTAAIAEELGVTMRHVQIVRRELENTGLLAMLLTSATAGDPPFEEDAD